MKTKLLAILATVLLAVTIQSATLSVRRVKNANTPPTPTNFTVGFIGDQPTNVFLTWGNASSTYSNIVVERTTNVTAWEVVTNIAGTNVAFTDLYTWTNTATYYRIKAIGSNLFESDYNNTR